MDFYVASIVFDFVKDKIFSFDAIKYDISKIDDEDMREDF